MAAAPSRSSILFALCLLASGTLLSLDIQGAQAMGALQVPVQHGQGPRLRARSQGHLAEWALKERQRLVGKYGPDQGPSVNANGLQPLLRRYGDDDDDEGQGGVQRPRPTGRQLRPRQQSISSGSASASSSANRTTGLATLGSSTAPSVAAATTTGLVGTIPNNRTINPRTGYANLTNYQADLCVRCSESRSLRALCACARWCLGLTASLCCRPPPGNTM